MSSLRTICLMAMAIVWVSTSSAAFASSVFSINKNTISYSEGEGNLTLSIENGSTGILTIKYIMILPDLAGRSSYVLFADSGEFTDFAEAVAESEGPVIADLDGTQISMRLYASGSGSRLYGHIIDSNERVYVVPSYWCRRLKCSR